MANLWGTLSKPFTVLAPMDDVTDNVFRKVVNDIARPDIFFTEFTNVDGIISSGSQIVKRKLRFEASQRPIVAQIWGSNPESFLKASKVVQEMGFDGIDINMGCPVREVVKKSAGAGLIGNYDLAGQIISAVKKGAGDLPVSVKTRLGINKNIAEEWATFLLNQDLAALTIHGRTAVQMSKVPADWEEIGKIVKIKNKIAPHTQIVGNGDIKDYKEVMLMHQRYDIDGVMIGRGIFENPWVFNKNKINHSTQNYIDLLLKHFDYFEKDNPDPVTQKKRYQALKKFFKMYIKEFDGASVFRQRLMETNTINEARALLSNNNFV